MSWISDKDVEDRLKAEAELDFKRLGHNKMAGWVKDGKVWKARCHECNALCSISPRSLGHIRIRGEAVLFRCGSKK